MKTHWCLTWLMGLVLVLTLAGLPRPGAESEAILSLVDTVEVGGRPGAVLLDADQERDDVLIYDRAGGQLRVLDGDSITLVPDAIPLPTADWDTGMAYDRVTHRTYALTPQRVGAYPNTWTELTVNVLSRRQVVNSFSVNGHPNSDPLNPVDTVCEVGGLAFRQPLSEGSNPGRLIIDNPKQGTLDVVDLNATGIQTTTLQRRAYRAPVPTTGYRLNRGNTLVPEPRNETRTPDDSDRRICSTWPI